ncbi:MAG: sugar phosphate isomerase/epimerase family protein [Ginsengibacter sp.]
MKRKISGLFFKFLLSLCLASLGSFAQPKSYPDPLKIGASFSLETVTTTAMSDAKSAGISSIQVSVNGWFDKSGHFKMTEEEISKEVNDARKAAADAGINIWAIHMPFGRYIDISLISETERQKVVAIHKKVLQLCRVLKPEVILFHPSWYLSLDQRDEHINQMIKSVLELAKPVKDLGAIMVIENMTGPELYVMSQGIKYERPLCRTVDETMKIMNKLPSQIYAAVDMNHMLHPEKLILALGNRLKFVHVSDGDGENELHYFPCSGKGMNDWMAILAALYKAEYSGPFMYECHYKDLKDLTVCYNYMYNKFIIENYIKLKYKE